VFREREGARATINDASGLPRGEVVGPARFTGSSAGRAETTAATGRVRKRVDDTERAPLDPLDNELRDAITSVELVLGDRIGVHEQDLQLVSVTGIDEAGGVQAGHAVPKGESAPRLDEAGVTLGQGQRHPGGHESPAATGRQQDVHPRHQIGSGVAGVGIARHREVGIETDDRDVEHGSDVRAGTSAGLA
jgi:hypothetical protein